MRRSVIIILIVIAATVFTILYKNPVSQEAILQSMNFQTKSETVTYQGYPSKKITGSRDGEQVEIQEIYNVNQKESATVTNKLNSLIMNIQENFTITDPYSGRTTELSIPEELKPLKKETHISGEVLTYYIIYVNEILSPMIFSKTEVKFKGIFSAYYCPKTNTSYRTGIFQRVNSFNEDEALNILASVFCK